MTKHLQTLALACAWTLTSTAMVLAQEKPKAPAVIKMPAIEQAVQAVTPLKVQVVIARFQGEKKLSSMPYTMTMNAGGHANIRMGTKIPVMMVSGIGDVKTPDGHAIPQVGPIQYQDVGTNIDCSATEVEGSRYAVNISVDDTSVYPDEQAGASKSNPSFRSFRAANTMVLKHGETGQFTTATDKVSGETVRVDVTLTVIK